MVLLLTCENASTMAQCEREEECEKRCSVKCELLMSLVTLRSVL